MFIPDPDIDFFTHPGSRIQGSKRHRIPDNTVFLITSDESDIETFNSATDPASVWNPVWADRRHLAYSGLDLFDIKICIIQ
jgi:hypothetical protein